MASSFAGERLLVGANAELTYGRWLLEGEWLSVQLDAKEGASSHPYGFYVTGGASLAPGHQLLLRYETLDSDRPDLDRFEDLTLGYTLLWSDAIKAQVNYTASTDDLAEGHWGTRLQFGLF